jgi:hypothetical protein
MQKNLRMHSMLQHRVTRVVCEKNAQNVAQPFLSQISCITLAVEKVA